MLNTNRSLGAYAELRGVSDVDSDSDIFLEAPDSMPQETEAIRNFGGAPEVNLSPDQNPSLVSTPDADQEHLDRPPDSSNQRVEGSSSNIAVYNNNLQADGDLERQQERGLSAKQKAMKIVHYIFPFRQTYERLHNGINTGLLQTNNPGQFVGQGTDGVFRNLMAKPDTETTRIAQEQHPPTYEEAAADATPEYWESTMMSPIYEDEVFVQGLPVGNIANFVWNILVTVAFQLVGFLLCYLLHTSHAAKHGSRAGLGIYLVTYGHSRIPANLGRPDKIPPRYIPDNPNLLDISKSLSIKSGGRVDKYQLGFQQHLDSLAREVSLREPYFAYGVIAFGIFMVLKAVYDFYHVKQMERSMLAPQAQPETHTSTEPADGPSED